MSYEKEYYLIETGYGFDTKKGRGFSRGNYIPIRKINEFIERRNNRSVFCTVYRYNALNVNSVINTEDGIMPDNAMLYGDLYLDFDDIDCYDNVKVDALIALSYLKIVYHIKEDQVKIFFSGNKGVHIVVPADILGVTPTSELNHIFKNIALSINTFSKNKTIDTQIYDNKRMFRVPNSLHEKSNLYKVPITFNELKNLSEEQIKNLAKQPRQIQTKEITKINNIARQAFQKNITEYEANKKEAKKDKKYNAKLKVIPPCVQCLIDNGAQEGQRNISIACLASFYRNYGKSLNETTDIISDWNSRNYVPTGEVELQKTVRSIFTSQKSYGCSTLKLISDCNINKCQLIKKKEGNENVIRS